jgi:hypothetical protein
MSEFTTEMTEVMIDPVTGEIIDQKELAERLLAQAKEQGVSLLDLGGLLNQLTKKVIETALEAANPTLFPSGEVILHVVRVLLNDEETQP